MAWVKPKEFNLESVVSHHDSYWSQHLDVPRRPGIKVCVGVGGWGRINQ